MASTSEFYIARFETDSFTQNQLRLLHKVAKGFLSPLHDQCVDTKTHKKMDPHYEAILEFDEPISNAECKKRLGILKYKVSHVTKADDMQHGTVRICNMLGRTGREGWYDHNQLQWFGLKKDQPDYRLWFLLPHLYEVFVERIPGLDG